MSDVGYTTRAPRIDHRAGRVTQEATGKTRFVVKLPGLDIELEGEKTFVEELYRAIYRDFAPVVEAAREGHQAHELALQVQRLQDESPAQRRRGHTWLYLCTAYFNKVYVIDNSRLEATFLGRFVDIDHIRRVYIDKEESPLLAGLTDNDRTLWAEFTDEGRAALAALKRP